MSVDMPARIDRVASMPSRFAVDVPHAVSPNIHGSWTTSGSTSTWRHALQIPGAVSMSFHASGVQWPAGAVLKVSAGGTEYLYQAKDIHHGELWSRIGRGDTISLELTLPTKDRPALRFDIASLQAGYRSFDDPRRDHPHFKALSHAGTAAAVATESCVENWACHTTSANTGPGQATVALIIGNVGQCTGVLLNSVPGDGTPYVLTARHCENGDPDGGAPWAAGNVSVYWNAVTPCSQPLGTIYSPGITVQYGATTMVEQQDAWLIRLTQLPIVDNAYYAGWDATGATFVGGFTPHHGLGGSKQFISWFGQASYLTYSGSDLDVGFPSTIWGTVNAVGSGAPGASGAGIFDDNARLVGTLVRGKSQGSGDDSPGVCPAPSPPAPSRETSTVFSTAFSGIFSSTADPKSTTGPATLQSVLDPDHTGRLVVDGQTPPPSIEFTTSVGSDPNAGFPIYIYWTSKRSTSCTAAGGVSGDGWAGAKGLSGTAQVTNFDGGEVEYSLTCTDGTRSVTKRAKVRWELGPATLSLSQSDGLPQYGQPFQLQWYTNLRPCVGSGGKTGDGWAGTYPTATSTSVMETEPGQVTYTITCGSGARSLTDHVTVDVRAPSALIDADVTSIRIGEPVRLHVQTVGKPCVKSGGAPGDGWSGQMSEDGFFSVNYNVTTSTPGTYTYKVTCGSGAYVATAQKSVTFTGGAPGVTLIASPNTVAAKSVDGTAGGDVTLTWHSNVKPCHVSVISPFIGEVAAGDAPNGSVLVQSVVIGDITYGVTCGSGPTLTQATAHVNYTGAPAVTLVSQATAVAGSEFIIEVEGNTLLPCVGTGGSSGDGWNGPITTVARYLVPRAVASIVVVERNAGTYTYTITCGSGAQTSTAQTTVTVLATPPFVTVTSSKTHVLLGEPVTITWNSNTSPCTTAGGAGDDQWGGLRVASSGSTTLTSNREGTFGYFVQCGSAPLFANGSVPVTFAKVLPPSLRASASTATVGQAVTLTWSSSDGSTCFADGGAGADEWLGNKPASGSQEVRAPGQGVITYFLTCGTASRVYVNVEFVPPTAIPQQALPPTVLLSASATTVTAGDQLTLTYTPANADACTAAGGSVADGWQTNALVISGGAVTVKETSPGSYTYSITCSKSGFASVTSTVTVTVKAQANTPPTSSGGGGGGGSLALVDLLALAGLLVMATMRNRRRPLGD